MNYLRAADCDPERTFNRLQRRWRGIFTGKQARLEASGQHFEEVAAIRTPPAALAPAAEELA